MWRGADEGFGGEMDEGGLEGGSLIRRVGVMIEGNKALGTLAEQSGGFVQSVVYALTAHGVLNGGCVRLAAYAKNCPERIV